MVSLVPLVGFVMLALKVFSRSVSCPIRSGESGLSSAQAELVITLVKTRMNP